MNPFLHWAERRRERAEIDHAIERLQARKATLRDQAKLYFDPLSDQQQQEALDIPDALFHAPHHAETKPSP